MLCDLCKCEINEINETRESLKLTTNDIINKVCEIYGISPSLALGKLRWKKLVECRHIIIHILRNDRYLNMSYKTIGNVVGGRDHTTVIHALKSVENYISVEPEYKQKVIDIYTEIYGSPKYFHC